MTTLTEIKIRSQKHQLFVLGVLCILLVPLCLLFGLFGLDTNPEGWYQSISRTYHANCKPIMIGELCSIGVYFLTYQGYDWRDRILSLIQGISSYGIVLFPCKLPNSVLPIGMFNLNPNLSQKLHVTATAVLFITFFISLEFLFTRSSGTITEKKKLRNKIYYICGGIILFGMILTCLDSLYFDRYIPNWFPITIVLEFIMLVPFGFAYMVKSECFKFLNDDYREKKL